MILADKWRYENVEANALRRGHVTKYINKQTTYVKRSTSDIGVIFHLTISCLLQNFDDMLLTYKDCSTVDHSKSVSEIL
ncbi:hypothetical protein C0J52_12533 [Blattella germanica]|nr:hypothetical protein C0J52_12533 [Blattella germanica]